MSRTLPALAAAAGLVLAGCAAGEEPSAGATSPAPLPPPASAPPQSTLTTPAEPGCAEPPCYGAVEHLGVLGADVVEQVSGMAASHRTPGLFYVVSDEADTSSVAVIDEGGRLVAHIDVDGMSARNAEALAVGRCDAGSADTCLYIGDIGNHADLEELFVYRVAEPDLTDPPASVAADRLRYTYPGEPTDAEALIVDDAGRPLIISKARFDESTGETGPTGLYRGARDGGTLEELGQIELPDPVSNLFAGMVGHVVTGADTLDGRVILRTYDEIYEYVALDANADLAGFPYWPSRLVPAPFQVQSETIAYRVDGCGYLTTSEVTGSIDAVACE